MSLFATFEAFPFLSKGGSFVVGQGSPGMGTSRGKIHGIWVLCKTLLPLLFGGSLIWSLGVELLSSKISLVCEVFTMLADSAFNPVLQSLIVMGWFKGEHRFLQSLRESLEVFPAYHAGQFVVSSQFGQLLELGRVFIQLSPLHFESKSFFSALSRLMTSWKFWAKSLIMVSQIHLSVSLPPILRCRSNCADIFLIQRCIFGPLR